MNNTIKNWSYDKPTEPGDYFICWGDVETEANVRFTKIAFHDGLGCLLDDEGVVVSGNYANGYKFARLVYSPTEIKEIEE